MRMMLRVGAATTAAVTVWLCACRRSVVPTTGPAVAPSAGETSVGLPPHSRAPADTAQTTDGGPRLPGEPRAAGPTQWARYPVLPESDSGGKDAPKREPEAADKRGRAGQEPGKQASSGGKDAPKREPEEADKRGRAGQEPGKQASSGGKDAPKREPEAADKRGRAGQEPGKQASPGGKDAPKREPEAADKRGRAGSAGTGGQEPGQGASQTSLSHKEALRRLGEAGIRVNKPEPATSLEGIRKETIDALTEFRRRTGLELVVTGGTEQNHAPGPRSHANGWKTDIRLTDALEAYAKRSLRCVGKRANGDPIYTDGKHTFVRERTHWDVTWCSPP